MVFKNIKGDNVKNKQREHGARGRRARPRIAGGMLGLSAALYCASGMAFDIDTGNADLKLNWDNTLKYMAMERLKKPAAALTADPNQDDGDRNFKRGLVSSRVDWLSELDATYGEVGMRLSGAAWYDSLYNRSNQHDAPTSNALSVGANEFPDATARLHGRKGELLDAFVFGKFALADMPATVRLGKHTLVYGETLFFGANGIAAAQGPVDAIKLFSVPNSQFKELLMPVNQLSGQLQIDTSWSVGGYYQLDWRRSRVPAAGSYFSTLDFLDAGGERVFVAPGASFNRGADVRAGDHGQGGLQARFRPRGSDVEYGFYAARYNDKTPQIYLTPGAGFNPATGQVGQYRLVFPEGIKTAGASFSTLIGDANVAGELSYRDHMPLVSDAQIDPSGAADNDARALYAIGKSAHLNLSAIYAIGKSAMFDNAVLTAELGMNRLLGVTRNRSALDPNTARDAWGARMIFEPNYYQVAPGVDLAVPIGLGYNFGGNSAVVGAFNGGPDKGGDLSIGVKGSYLGATKFALNYNHYLGSGKTTLDAARGNQFNFGQPLKDRDYLSLSLQYAF